MKSKSLVLLVLLISSVIALPITLEKILTEYLTPASNDEFTYKTFQIEKDKWGYYISHYDKMFIKQSYIPAVSGKVCFKSESDAAKTAKFVIAKLNRKEIPSLTVQDLKNLGVID